MKKTFIVLNLFSVFSIFCYSQNTKMNSENRAVYDEASIADSLLNVCYDSLELLVEKDILATIKSDLQLDKSDFAYSFDMYTLKLFFDTADSLVLISPGEYPERCKSLMTNKRTRHKYLKFIEKTMSKMQIPYEIINKFGISFYLYLDGIRYLYAEYELKFNLGKIEIGNKNIKYLTSQ
jgi:hypothetical protein